MKAFRFDPEKYGFELNMDLHRFETNPALHFDHRLHTIDFFEIMIFREGNGSFESGDHKVKLEPGTLLFASPNQFKKCCFDEASVRGFHLIFRDAFISDFFHDQLLVYRLRYLG